MPEDATKRSLRYSIYDGTASAVMDGMTASFLTPFAIALNASVNLIAALSYVPQLVGAFTQLFAAKIVELLRDRRRILVVSAFIHAILWIPMLLIPYLNRNQAYLLVFYVAIQTIFVQIMVPVGNSLLGDIVPKYERGRFFGLRNKVVGVTTFLSALSAGFILNYFAPKNPFAGFAILFSIAFAGRSTSAFFKAMMINPAADLEHAEKFSIFDFVKKMEKTNYGHFVIYLSLFKFATSIAAPFFAVYMLQNLNFSYLQFTIVIASELVASFIAMGIWGKLIDGRGTKHVLFITGILTPLIPFFWLFSKNFYYLIAVEVFSGLAWAGFNLSSSNFIFDAVQPENRVRCIAYYKFFESISIFTGAALGGFLISHMPSWIFASTILLVFFISGVLRLLVSLILLPTLKEARLIEMGIGHSFFKRYLTIRPSEGLVFEVIGKYHRVREKIEEVKELIKKTEPKFADKKASQDYNKKLLKFIEKSISPKKEQHDISNIHDIEYITEEIEKGKMRK